MFKIPRGKKKKNPEYCYVTCNMKEDETIFRCAMAETTCSSKFSRTSQMPIKFNFLHLLPTLVLAIQSKAISPKF